jgi:hypothetical protein
MRQGRSLYCGHSPAGSDEQHFLSPGPAVEGLARRHSRSRSVATLSPTPAELVAQSSPAAALAPIAPNLGRASVEISIVRFRGRSYQVTLNPDGCPVEIKREGASKHRRGHWVRIWHRRQGPPGRQSVIVAGILRMTEQMTEDHLSPAPAEAQACIPATAQEAGAQRRHHQPSRGQTVGASSSAANRVVLTERCRSAES